MPVQNINPNENKVLVYLDKILNINHLAGKPLPQTVFNSTGAKVADKGQVLSADQLKKVYVYTEKKKSNFNFKVSKEGEYFAQHPDYREENCEEIEKHLEELTFQPLPRVEEVFKETVHSIKDLYKTKRQGDRISLNSENNKALSFSVVNALDAILESSMMSGDYVDIIKKIRNKNNYFSFSHVAAVCFYSMAIARKLKMLKEDFFTRPNHGRWLSIKTENNPEGYKALRFSNQMLKYFDNQKNLVMSKYTHVDIRDAIFEKIHDIMHQYGRIILDDSQPSFQLSYDMQNIYMIGIAALNANIGKLFYPNQIINKPGPLSEKEFSLIKSHPIISVKKLKEAQFNHARIHAYILGHHINGPGNSYPTLKFTPFYESKIILLAEMYDAMRSPRHYGKIYKQDDIFKILEKKHNNGTIDYPLYITAMHTFLEFDNEYVDQRTHDRIKESDLA